MSEPPLIRVLITQKANSNYQLLVWFGAQQLIELEASELHHIKRLADAILESVKSEMGE